MTKPLPFTKAAISRVIRAAQQEGAAGIEMKPDGTIRVLLRKDYKLAVDGQREQTDETGADPWVVEV